jgi:SAM-dependent methyltransferase
MKLYPRHSRLWLVLNRLNIFLEKNASKSKGVLLDIGGENTPYIELFRPHIKKYICLNLKKVNNSADENIVGDAMKLPFKNNSIDTVLSTQVLEHLKDPQKAIDEIFRVLKKGGVCILSTNMAWINHAVPDDYYRYTESGLKYLFRNFSKKKTYSLGGYILTLFQFVVLLTKPLPFFIKNPINFVLNSIGNFLDKKIRINKLSPITAIIAKK